MPGAGSRTQPFEAAMFVGTLVVAEKLAALDIGFTTAVVADTTRGQTPDREAGLGCFDATVNEGFVNSIGIVANIGHDINLSRQCP